MRRKSKKTSKIKFSQVLFTMLGVVIVVLISIPLSKNLKKEYLVSQEIKELEEEIQSLETRNVELGELITFFESEQFIEEQARLKLNYKEEGEEVFVISDNQSAEEVKSEATLFSRNKKPERESKLKNNAVIWWDYFF